MMFVDLVAFDPPPEPPPVILSLIPDAAPLRAPRTGESPSAAALPPSVAAFPAELPSAIPSSLSVIPPTESVTALIALSPRVLSSSWETSLSLSIGWLSVAISDHRPDPDRLERADPDDDFFAVVRDEEVFLAGDFLAALFFAGAFFAGDFLAADFLVGAFLAAVFLAGALLGRADFFLAVLPARRSLPGGLLARTASRWFRLFLLVVVRSRPRPPRPAASSVGLVLASTRPPPRPRARRLPRSLGLVLVLVLVLGVVLVLVSPSSWLPDSFSDRVIDSSRVVAVVMAAALAASTILPVTCSLSFLSSGFWSASLDPCANSAWGFVAMRWPASMLPTVIASLSFLVRPSR